ncbi:MAG TPA: MBL fold metallo-hydrolase [Actinomycetota bacterium]|nr:MBL fold metallo-hydrolase [Actinomycetota bacterium]
MGYSEVTDRVARMWFPAIDNNAFLIRAGSASTLVDCGPPGKGGLVAKALARCGLRPADVRHLVVTHCHTDHTGNLASVAAGGDVTVYGHPVDARIIREGAERPRGAANRLLGRVMLAMAKRSSSAPAAPVQAELRGGEELEAAGGITCIATPGHTEGHLSYLWGEGKVLFVGDAATRMFRRLDVAPINEADGEARSSFARLAELDFDVACFGHGSPIRGRAALRFRRRLDHVAAHGR